MQVLLPAALLTLLPSTLQEVSGEVELAGQRLLRNEARANVFTQSTQDAVSLATAPAGGGVLVWQSRRQEEGTYGIYARRFDDHGFMIGEEVRVNETVASMQMEPAVAIDGDGAVWFAWRSFGQGAGGWAVVARRFEPGLGVGGAEVLLDPDGAGDQGDVLIEGLPTGGVRALWTAPDGASSRTNLYATTIDARGRVDGPRQQLDVGLESGVRTPVLASSGSRTWVVWAGYGDGGVPAGLWLGGWDEEGELRAPRRLEVPSGAIEPALALDDEGALGLVWFEARGARYELQFRRGRCVDGQVAWQPTVDLAGPGEGWQMGAELLAGPERWMLVYGSRVDGPRKDTGLFACILEPNGEPAAAPIRFTRAVDGPQSLTLGRGTQRSFWDRDGRVGMAWAGEAGLGDGSGAHLTVLRPEKHVARAADEPVEVLSQVAEAVEREDEAALPHDPPTFDPRQREPRPDEPPNLTYGLGDMDFLGITHTGWWPSDSHMAVGSDHLVLMTNGAISWFDKSGTQLFQDEIEGAGGFWGAQGAGGFVFDPEVIYDPHTGRFMAQAAEREGQESYFELAISDDSSAPGTWHKYRIDTTPFLDEPEIDSTNIAVDADAIYLTGDFFEPARFLVLVIDKSSVLDGGNPVMTSTVITGHHSLGVPVTYDATAPAQYMVSSRLFTDSNVLDLWAVTDSLGAVSTQRTTVDVPSYSHPDDPPQLGTGATIKLVDARFWSTVYRNGFLWATHHQGEPARQRWYQIAMNGWPTSGQQPTLVQSGEVDLGPDTHTYFGSIWADENDTMAMTYSRSSINEFISMERTFRKASDPLGTTRPGVSVISSNSPEISSRWGDYCATSDDPSNPGYFWGFSQYRRNKWRTRVVGWQIDPCTPSVSNYCSTSPNSAGPGALIQSSGSTSIGANDFEVQAMGLPPMQPGLFYYGTDETDQPFGNGRLCVGGAAIFRLPILSSDALGFAFHLLDYSNPPSSAAQITAGSTWKFQYWYRDPAGGNAAFNLTDGLSATFCP